MTTQLSVHRTENKYPISLIEASVLKKRLANVMYQDEYDEDERQNRDPFNFTIEEPLVADIILIEDFILSYYDIDNFADYEIPE